MVDRIRYLPPGEIWLLFWMVVVVAIVLFVALMEFCTVPLHLVFQSVWVPLCRWLVHPPPCALILLFWWRPISCHHPMFYRRSSVMLGSCRMYLLASLYLIIVGTATLLNISRCRCLHLLLVPFSSMLWVWAFVPLFYLLRWCRSSRLPNRRWVVLHSPPPPCLLLSYPSSLILGKVERNLIVSEVDNRRWRSAPLLVDQTSRR